MRPSNTGKSDPHQPAPAKRGFFAAAGERLKRAMSGSRAPAAAATSAQETAEVGDGEVTTSVQAKARELLLHDRTTRRGQTPADTAEETTGARQRRTSPPPLPSQRMAADASPDALSGKAERTSTSRPRRPVRDSKSEALRARLGAAKAALAEAQAKRAAEQASVSQDAKPEIAETPSAASAAEAVSSDAQAQQPSAAAEPRSEQASAQPSAADGDDDGAEPIRTLTIARLLARQGYYDRSLSIYDELLIENAEDSELQAEAAQVRAKQADNPAPETSS